VELYNTLASSNGSDETFARWQQLIKELLDAAQQIAVLLMMGDSVLLHHSVSCDLDYCVSSLAQLILDGYYRTITGFAVLIEKDWVSYGYAFTHKIGHARETDEFGEQSPSFQIFMECVWQLLLQYPMHFQFNEDLLIYILDSLYSCKFGTFLANSDRERSALRLYTPCVWASIHLKRKMWSSPFYEEDTQETIVTPSTVPTALKFWNSYYARHKQAFKTRRMFEKIEKMNRSAEEDEGDADSDEEANDGGEPDGFDASKSSIKKREYVAVRKVLDLTSLGLTILPASVVAMLTDLHTLSLSKNQFNAIPPAVYSLGSLRSLGMDHNPLNTLSRDHVDLLGRFLPHLQELNLSFAGVDVLPPELTRLQALRVLRASGNRIADVPANITQMTNLEVLDLRYNRVSSFSDSIAKLASLRILALAGNSIVKVPADLSGLPALEVLDLGLNKITESIPDSVFTLTTLVVLYLDNNHIASVSDSIAQLELLEELNISGNQVYELPKTIHRLKHLRKLHAEDNTLKSLPGNMAKMDQLREVFLNRNQFAHFPTALLTMHNLAVVHLEDNKLEALPTDIDQLTALRDINVASNNISTLDNCAGLGLLPKLQHINIKDNSITALPLTFGLLNGTVQSLEVDTEKMVVPPADVCARGLAHMMRNLSERLDAKEPNYRLRIIVVGANGAGKSTLIQALTGKSTGARIKNWADGGAPSFEGAIDFTSWSLNGVEIAKKQRKGDVLVDIWDFPDEELGFNAMKFFFNDRTLFLIVCDLRKDPEMSHLAHWAFALKSGAPRAPIIAVGTHGDELNTKDSNPRDLLNQAEYNYKKQYPNVKAYVTANAATTKGLAELRSALERVVSDLTFIGDNIPTPFFQLEKAIAYESQRRVPPVMTWKEFTATALRCGVAEPDVLAAARFLSSFAMLSFFEDERLNNTVLLDPRFLVVFLGTLLRNGREIGKDGIIRQRELRLLCKAPFFPESLHPLLLGVLEKFEIAFRLRVALGDGVKETQTLIPLMLPELPPIELEMIWPVQHPKGLQFGRRYTCPINATAFLWRAMVRLLRLAPNGLYWRYGMLIENRETGELIRVELKPMEKAVDVIVRTQDKLGSLFRHVFEAFDTVCRIMKLGVVVSVPCSHCLQAHSLHPFFFPLEVCEKAAMRDHVVYCEDVRPLKVDSLVPDLAMAFYAGQRLYASDLELGKKLGEGAAAEVFHGTLFGDKPVAIKRLRILDDSGTIGAEQLIAAATDTEVSKSFAEFRREVWLMSSIDHPAIVAMYGVVLNPLTIVTEFIAGGNLFDFIHGEHREDFDWKVRLKIALDICSGLDYMHGFQPPIIHRDLKSPNILVRRLFSFLGVVASAENRLTQCDPVMFASATIANSTTKGLAQV
jgi:Leucine-rich repeat (LRR) protein/GTPase SAR1 family protein